MYIYYYISADPCRQQGERVRGGLTSNKMQEGAKREPPAWTEAVQNESQLQETEAVQNESQLQEDTSRVAVGSAETEVKSRFES